MSLWRYGELLGLNPYHLAGATAPGFFAPTSQYSRMFPRYSWQSDNVSQSEIMDAIREAEDAIASLIHRQVGPTWIVQEEHMYPGGTSGWGKTRNPNGLNRVVQLKYGDLIAPGVRATSSISLGTELVFKDEDGDGFTEYAEIEFYTGYSLREVHFFHPDRDAHPGWVIEPSSLEQDENGLVTARFDTFRLIKPELAARMPGDIPEYVGVDATESNNVLSAIDVYRVYNDTTLPHVRLVYEHGVPCVTTGPYEADGFATVRSRDSSLVAPLPGTYDASVGAWREDTACANVLPTRVYVSYYCGIESPDWVKGRKISSVPHDMERTIMMLATARLHREICGNPNVEALARDYRQDMALMSEQGNFLAVADVIQECPLGTRRGEWLAWNKIQQTDKHRIVTIV